MAKQYYGNRDRFQPDSIVKADIPDLSKLNGKHIDQRARATAEALVKGDRLKTHQLRNVYASIEELRTAFKKSNRYTDELGDSLYLLKPQLAYAAGRQTAVNTTLFPFISLLIDSIDKATDKDKAMRNFFALVESVVGYHKYFENVRDAK